jgi:hypothetical protein
VNHIGTFLSDILEAGGRLFLAVKPTEKYLHLHQFLLNKWRERELGKDRG